eukprot:768102-Hanusia_phi.AAC.2
MRCILCVERASLHSIDQELELLHGSFSGYSCRRLIIARKLAAGSTWRRWVLLRSRLGVAGYLGKFEIKDTRGPRR